MKGEISSVRGNGVPKSETFGISVSGRVSNLERAGMGGVNFAEIEEEM